MLLTITCEWCHEALQREEARKRTKAEPMRRLLSATIRGVVPDAYSSPDRRTSLGRCVPIEHRPASGSVILWVQNSGHLPARGFAVRMYMSAERRNGEGNPVTPLESILEPAHRTTRVYWRM